MVPVKQRTLTWNDLIELFRSQKSWMNGIVAALDVTPQMAHALNEIPESGSITMKVLSAALMCDASNMTGIIDRLEARALVERRADPDDRRVKCVALTPAGKRLRKRIDEAFNQPPPAIAAMPVADQRALGTLIRQALTHAEAQRLERTGS
jgi:DNA-binding MarR family transcriptional regulator